MRALAVLVVLLFHLDVPEFAGGFLGVDLFFVISGFIITRNILSDLHHDSFSLKDFYRRRIRRLVPALLVTILLTLVAGLFIVPPVELVNTARSAIFASFSLANFYFWAESGYFDAAATTKPLLHTWSLSVEEQFYLFWPALLLLLATTRRRVLFAGLLLVLSLGSAFFWRNSFPDAVFYLLPFRLHQLMAGALIAILSLRLKASWGQLGTLLAAGGFVAVTVLLDDNYSPVIGAVAVTGLGSLLLLGREANIAQALFGNKPMQWIGQRSYALYLVHWPIIVLYKFLADSELHYGNRALLAVLSIVAAIGLHELVEKPFRKRGEDSTLPQRMALPATVTTLLATLVFASALWMQDGLPSRIDPDIQRIVDSVERETDLRRKAIRFGKCNLHQGHKFSAYNPDECAYLDPARKNVLVIGDSMAADTYMMLSQVYPEIHFSQASAGACTAIVRITDLGGRYSTCEALNAYRFSELVRLDVDLVVLASIWGENRIQPLKETVDYLHSLGKRVLIIGPRAHFREAVPLMVSKQASLEGANYRLGDSVLQDKGLLQQMRASIPDAEIVDIGAVQCEPGCDVIENGRLLYYDERHFTKLGAKRMGERFRKSFDLIQFVNAADASSPATPVSPEKVR